MQSKHLGEMCCHEIWGNFTTSHYLVPVFSPFVLGLVLIRVSFGGEPVCYIHLILHDMEKVSWCAIFVSFKLHGGQLPSLRPVPCCFWDVTKPVTYIHLLEISAFVLSFSHNMTSFICQPFPAQDYVIGCGHGMTAFRHNSWDFIRPVWWLQVVNSNVVCLLYHSFSETLLHICKHSGSCSRCIAAKSYAIKTIMSFYPHLCWKEFNLCTYRISKSRIFTQTIKKNISL